MHTIVLLLMLVVVGACDRPATPPLAGYETTPQGCRDLATGQYVPSSNCDPKAAP